MYRYIIIVLFTIILIGMTPALSVKANNIYQNDHVVLSSKVCGDKLCKNTEQSIFGSGGPHFVFNTHMSIPSNVTSYHVTIILPNSSFSHIDGILSSDNFTSLKQNIATMAVVNIYPSDIPPTLNYCPTALKILAGQDGYMGLIYNQTSKKDLTSFVYPPYCYTETGSNPIDGKGTISIPEFPQTEILIPLLVLIIYVSITVVIWNKYRCFYYKKTDDLSKS